MHWAEGLLVFTIVIHLDIQRKVPYIEGDSLVEEYHESTLHQFLGNQTIQSTD